MTTISTRLEMKSSLEHFSTQGNWLKMTTGTGGLDSSKALFYLFYGDTHIMLRNRTKLIKDNGSNLRVFALIK